MISLLNRFPLILLAAGQSSRMGQAKGLVPYRGQPWIMEQVSRFARAGGESIHLVLGHHVKEYFDQVPLLSKSKKVNVVVNPHPERGMFYSFQHALKEIDLHRIEALFVCPIDVPLPSPITWQILLQAMHVQTEAKAYLPNFKGQNGHPILIKATWAEELRELPWESPSARLDYQLSQLPPGKWVSVGVPDQAVTENLNTEEEFRDYSS